VAEACALLVGGITRIEQRSDHPVRKDLAHLSGGHEVARITVG
jgi:hypothetical protein